MRSRVEWVLLAACGLLTPACATSFSSGRTQRISHQREIESVVWAELLQQQFRNGGAPKAITMESGSDYGQALAVCLEPASRDKCAGRDRRVAVTVFDKWQQVNVDSGSVRVRYFIVSPTDRPASRSGRYSIASVETSWTLVHRGGRWLPRITGDIVVDDF
jgi:hypothetical protein